MKGSVKKNLCNMSLTLRTFSQNKSRSPSFFLLKIIKLLSEIFFEKISPFRNIRVYLLK